jgi:primase-polymerase (primpol)-like protein
MGATIVNEQTRPATLRVNAEGIPLGLRMANQWVMWRWEWRDGKWTKPPFQVNGASAKSDEPTTWTSFHQAVDTYRRGAFDGIGRMLAADEIYVGIDLDHCRNPETGTVAEWAIGVIRHFRSYTEVSPSGTGIRIIVRAKKPAGSRCRKGAIEIYNRGRYLTITGHVLEPYQPLSPDRRRWSDSSLTYSAK